MKSMAKLLALVFALSMLAPAALGEELINTEGTYPIVNEPYEVSIGFIASSDGIDLDQFYFTAYMDYLTGLDIEWTSIDASARGERLPLMMATGDFPDAMIAVGFYVNDIMRYGMQEGLLRPVNDLLQYMPNFKAITDANPQILQDMTCLDGNYYGFPRLSAGLGFDIRFWYNQQWLERLDLAVPTTLDELYNVLVAFRDEDADGDGETDDEIPFSGSWDNGYNERAPIMTAMGFNSSGNYLGINFLAEQPSIGYFPYTEQYYDYLVYMKKLFDEGLMDPDMFTQSEVQYNAKTLEGNVGFGGGAANFTMNTDPDVYTGYIPMTSEVCDLPLYPQLTSPVTSIAMIINSEVSDEKAIVLAKLDDAFYDPRTSIETCEGIDLGSELDFFGWGNVYNKEEGIVEYSNKPEDVDDWTFLTRYMAPYDQPGYNMAAANMIPYAIDHPDTALGQLYADYGYVYEDWNLQYQEQCQPYANYVVPNFYMEEEDLERITELSTPLDDYARSMEAQFITGAISLEEEFDAFRAELENLGVQEYIDIYAKYWDPYYSALNPDAQ